MTTPPSHSEPSAAPLRGISSMATRLLLGELLAQWQAGGGTPVAMESVGGVDAAKRVAAGEAFDVVVLGSDAIAKLAAAGHTLAGSTLAVVHSGVAVAVPAGAPAPDLRSEAAVLQAVLEAPSLSYSTGPSGAALAQLFERWGLAEAVQAKLVVPPPGVPVGSLLASGQVALGFQQLAELMHLPGIQVLGPLPPAIQITTVFAGAVVAGSGRADEARALLHFLASPATAEAKRRHGMAPA